VASNDDLGDGGDHVSEQRTEKQVLEALSDEQRALLKRVLEIERAKLHITAYDATDDLLAAVKEIIP
jgi:conjugal transfer/entry exclusion protein